MLEASATSSSVLKLDNELVLELLVLRIVQSSLVLLSDMLLPGGASTSSGDVATSTVGCVRGKKPTHFGGSGFEGNRNEMMDDNNEGLVIVLAVAACWKKEKKKQSVSNYGNKQIVPPAVKKHQSCHRNPIKIENGISGRSRPAYQKFLRSPSTICFFAYHPDPLKPLCPSMRCEKKKETTKLTMVAAAAVEILLLLLLLFFVSALFWALCVSPLCCCSSVTAGSDDFRRLRGLCFGIVP